MKPIVTAILFATLSLGASSAGAQTGAAQGVAGCYSLDDHGYEKTFSLPLRIELDTARVNVQLPYRVQATATFGVHGHQPLDSTAEASVRPAARQVAYWYFVGSDSLVVYKHGKFTTHELRLHVGRDALTGQQKYTTDAFDPNNPPKWMPAVARKVGCTGR
jgi:hypothetical protein